MNQFIVPNPISTTELFHPRTRRKYRIASHVQRFEFRDEHVAESGPKVCESRTIEIPEKLDIWEGTKVDSTLGTAVLT